MTKSTWPVPAGRSVPPPPRSVMVGVLSFFGTRGIVFHHNGPYHSTDGPEDPETGHRLHCLYEEGVDSSTGSVEISFTWGRPRADPLGQVILTRNDTGWHLRIESVWGHTTPEAWPALRGLAAAIDTQVEQLVLGVPIPLDEAHVPWVGEWMVAMYRHHEALASKLAAGPRLLPRSAVLMPLNPDPTTPESRLRFSRQIVYFFGALGVELHPARGKLGWYTTDQANQSSLHRLVCGWGDQCLIYYLEGTGFAPSDTNLCWPEAGALRMVRLAYAESHVAVAIDSPHDLSNGPREVTTEWPAVTRLGEITGLPLTRRGTSLVLELQVPYQHLDDVCRWLAELYLHGQAKLAEMRAGPR